MLLSGLLITLLIFMSWFIIAVVIKFITLFLGVAFSLGLVTFIWFVIMIFLFIFATTTNSEHDEEGDM